MAQPLHPVASARHAPPLQAGRYFVVLGAWLAGALGAGALGWTANLRPPLPQVILFGLTIALLAAFWRGKKFRAWVLSLPPRVLVRLHAVRFIGFYFLALYARGELPLAFAVPGGWGDIATATLALAVSILSAESKVGRRVYFAWNIFGLLDITFVVITATRLFVANPDSMKALLQLPLSLLPTFIVPLIIATHIALFVRLALLGEKRDRDGQ